MIDNLQLLQHIIQDLENLDREGFQAWIETVDLSPLMEARVRRQEAKRKLVEIEWKLSKIK